MSEKKADFVIEAQKRQREREDKDFFMDRFESIACRNCKHYAGPGTGTGFVLCKKEKVAIEFDDMLDFPDEHPDCGKYKCEFIKMGNVEVSDSKGLGCDWFKEKKV